MRKQKTEEALNATKNEIMRYGEEYNGLMPTLRWVSGKTGFSKNKVWRMFQKLEFKGVIGKTEDDRYYIKGEDDE